MLPNDLMRLTLPEPVVLSAEETEHVAGGASAPYNTPGNPDYGKVPNSPGHAPVKNLE
jgi:hypothetical protein